MEEGPHVCESQGQGTQSVSPNCGKPPRGQADPATGRGHPGAGGRELGLDRVLTYLLRDRGFEFPVERAVYLTVLHRLFESGSDRAAEKWRRDVPVPGGGHLGFTHLYRAMRW